MLTLTAACLAGCDQQKALIEDKKEATKDAIDNRKDAVDAAAKDAKKQTEIDAAIDKAKIDAKTAATQAQLDADKKKADAQAALEKAKVDAVKWVSGDEKLKSYTDALRTADYRLTFPDDTPVKVLRRGTLSCSVAKALDAFDQSVAISFDRARRDEVSQRTDSPVIVHNVPFSVAIVAPPTAITFR